MKRVVAFILALVLAEILCVSGFTTDVGLDNFETVVDYENGQFVDVDENSWYANDIELAYELGLVKGVSDTAFNPSGNLKVIEAIILACRLHSIYVGSGSEFKQGTPWYQVYIDYAVQNGIIEANQNLTYDANATRIQFAAILVLAFPEYELEEINIIEKDSIPDVPLAMEGASAVYRLYRAGILTGSDSKGAFKPFNNIQRSEVATIVSRMVNKGLRKDIELFQQKILPTEQEWRNAPKASALYLKYDDKLYDINGHLGKFVNINGELYARDIVHLVDIAEGEAAFDSSDNPFIAGEYRSDYDISNPFSVLDDVEVKYLSVSKYFHIRRYTYQEKSFSTPSVVKFGAFENDGIRMYGVPFETSAYQGEVSYYYNISDVLSFWGLEGTFSFALFDDETGAENVLFFLK